MSFLSCAEMLTYAHEHSCTLAQAVLRSDLAESRLTEEASRAQMRRLWQVMQQTSRDYDPSRRSRSGLVGGDAAKVEQAAAQGRLLGGAYLSAVTAEALKTAECNACMKRIVAAPTAGSCGVLPAVLLPLAQEGQASDEAICDALYVAAGFGQVIAARATPGRRGGRLSGRSGRRQRHGGRRPLLSERRHRCRLRRSRSHGSWQSAGACL